MRSIACLLILVLLVIPTSTFLVPTLLRSPLSLRSPHVFSKPLSSPSPLPLYSSPQPPDSLDDFSLPQTLKLLSLQSIFIPASLLFMKYKAMPLPAVTWPLVVIGLKYTIPLFVLIIATSLLEPYVPALKKVTYATEATVLNLLGNTFSPLRCLQISILLGSIAGVGEELAFRQCLLGSIATILPIRTAAILSSSLFALGHAITPLCAILSFLASIYFCYVYHTSGLVAASVVHGVYDIVAIAVTHWQVTRKGEEEKKFIRSMEWLKEE